MFGDVGRNSSRLLNHLRDVVREGKVRSGDFMPTVRDLSQTHGVAFKTVQRALKALESEGLVVSEPRRGYRVQARAHDPNFGMPLAYINGDAGERDPWDLYHQTLQSSIRIAAQKQGWSLLGVGSVGRPRVVMEQLRAANAWGALLDTVDPELLQLASTAGMPVVMLDSWNENFNLDTVLQDNYRGGYLGAQHLVSLGHKRIGWLGAIGATVHSRERFAGAAAALAKANLGIDRSLRFEVSVYSEDELRTKARQFLSRAERPRACLTYWRPAAAAMVREAHAAGLKFGRDIDIVGWTAQELWSSYTADFAPNEIPPTVTWSMEAAAECALERLDQRRRRPNLPTVRIHVSTELKLS